MLNFVTGESYVFYLSFLSFLFSNFIVVLQGGGAGRGFKDKVLSTHNLCGSRNGLTFQQLRKKTQFCVYRQTTKTYTALFQNTGWMDG